MAREANEYIEADENGRYHKILTADLDLDFRTDPEWKRKFPWLKNGVKRYYVQEQFIGNGAFSVAFRARARHGKGFAKIPVVIKWPYVNPTSRTPEFWKRFTEKNYRNEFSLIARKLEGCKHANPIIDVISHQIPTEKIPHLDALTILTVQPYLENSINLDQWLREKQGADIRRVHGKLQANWGGILRKEKFIKIALAIAKAVKDVHLHRVTHADLHPGNIFVSKDGQPFVTLIDFGESFTAIPGQHHRPRTPKAYLSPERLGPRFPLGDSVDVYSFGILMMFLAAGEEPEIKHVSRNQDREFVDKFLCKKNQRLVKSDPRLIDLITRCVANDPGDRPSFTDICEDLQSFRNGKARNINPKGLKSMMSKLSKQLPESNKASDLPYHPILLRIVKRSVGELDAIVNGLRTDMVERKGTRDETLRVLVQLLDSMKKGDSWATMTTLSVWQHNALGLNGSYMSSTFNAVNRGASVRRIFVMSVEELGMPFCNEIVAQLRTTKAMDPLADQFNEAILAFKARKSDGKSGNGRTLKIPDGNYACWHRERLEKLLYHLNRMMRRWEVKGKRIAKPDGEGNYLIGEQGESQGLYVGFRIVATLDEVGALREANPASLLYFGNEANPVHRWVLVTTTIGNRASQGEGNDEFECPHLLGLRVFKSADAEEADSAPGQRLKAFRNLMNGEDSDENGMHHKAVNVTNCFGPFHKAVRMVRQKLGEVHS